MANQLVELILNEAAKRGERVAFQHRNYKTDQWEPTTWKEFGYRTERVACA